MRLGTFSVEGSDPRAAIITEDDGVVDIARASDGVLPASMLEVLQLDGWLSELTDLMASSPDADHPLDGVTLHAPIIRPGKILAAAGNYQAHIDEGGGAKVDKSRRTPRIFIKPSSSLVGHDEPLMLPMVSDEIDWELELAVVIGKTAREVSADDAMSHVGGYTILNDISARSMNWGIEDREVHAWDGFFDWLAGKWVDTFAPTGPWIVTADEIDDPYDLQLTLELNEEVTQNASTGTMIFDCSDLISFISRFTTLQPGDIIATGTPAGVGAAKGRYLRAGDVMVGSIEKIGTLRTPVIGS
jgi:2-keto-4-pentenoate hydratase/2-oxohepta-3-ene-1,7-dioic acid hydratase in catechol pathway